MLRFTKRSEHGLLVAAYLARCTRRFCPVRELIDELRVPRRMLGEILRDLLREGIVRVARGPGGGYQLQGSPEQISLSRLVEVLEGTSIPGPIVGNASGSPRGDLTAGLDELSARLGEVLDDFTLARFAKGFSEGPRRYRRPGFADPSPLKPSGEAFELLLK